jgi:hypothetical protein
MNNTIYKSDRIVSSKEACRLNKSLPEFISSLVKKDLSEIDSKYHESEIDEIVKENCILKFEINNIPFTIKVV